MIFWHLGMTLLVVRYVFRDPSMDLRWVLLGSIVPDLIDKPIGSILFNDTFRTHRLFSHSILFPVVGLMVVLIATRRGTALRKGLIGLVIGALVHLVLDAAWADPEAFWWPLFGLEFPHVANSAFGELVRGMLANPWVWVGEAVGLAYLAFLWRNRLGGDAQGFIRTGLVPLRSTEAPSRRRARDSSGGGLRSNRSES